MLRRIIICMLFAIVGTGIQIHAQQSDTLRYANGKDSVIRERIIVRDTIYITRSLEMEPDSSDMIRTKQIGRYNRGIINYRFIPKGKWIGGITASYIDFDSDDSRLLFALFKDFDCHGRTVSVKPFVGYSLVDNNVVGMKMGYTHTVGQLDNIALNMDDLDFSLQNMRYSEDYYNIALFHRSYIGLHVSKRFGLFNETALSFSTGNARFSRDVDEAFKSTETSVRELSLGINPGVSVFIMENVSAEVSFGVVGLKYRTEKQKNNQGESGERRSTGGDFKINLFNINIGITLCL